MSRARRWWFSAWLATAPLWFASGCDKPEAKPAAPPPQTVFVGHPSIDEVVDYEDFTGRTEAIYSVEIRARVTGYLEKVHFKDGDEVKEGAALLDIDDRPYKAEMNRAEAALAQSEAHLKRLEADSRRASNLLSRGSIGREEYDKIVGDRAEADAAVGIAHAQYKLSELNVGYTKISAPISGRLSRRLVDPGNLVIGDVTILTSIKSQNPLFVYFDIDERTLLRLRRLARDGKIQSYQQTKIPVLVALSDETDFPHQGLIDFRENAVDPGTGTLRARAQIDNPAPYLLTPGLFVRVRLPVGQPQKRTLVAEKALGSEQGEKYVYVVVDQNVMDKAGKAVLGDDGKPRTEKVAQKVRVKVGRLDGDRRVIEDVLDNRTLSPPDLVIVEGLQRVRAGASVSPQPATPPKAAGLKAPAAVAQGRAP